MTQDSAYLMNRQERAAKPTAYEKALETLREHRESLEELRPQLELLESIRDELYPDATVTIDSLDFEDAQIEVPVDSLKDLTPLLRRLRQAGHKLSRTADCREANTRLYIFDEARIRVDAKLNGTSCRYEVVGTKETPVYKIACDDGSLPSELEVFK